MKNKFFNTLKRFSNKVFKTTYLMSYEKRYLEDLHHSITFVSSTEDAFILNSAARYEIE